MFERFTDRARQVIVLAQEEARRLNHNYIGTEHILLGLIHEGEGVAAKVLRSMGVSLDEVRKDVWEIIGEGQAAPTGHIPFTPRAKKILELALREAIKLGHDYIGTEHILLGLVREGDGVGAQVLTKRGITLEGVRRKVLETIGERESPELGERSRFGVGHIHPPGGGRQGPSAMALFDEDAVRAIHRAQEIAARRNRPVIRSSDLLLGLLHESQPRVAEILTGWLGLQVSSVLESASRMAEETVEATTEEGPQEGPPGDRSPEEGSGGEG